MNKSAQSILDLLGLQDMRTQPSNLPVQIILRRSPVSNDEATALFAIWNSDKDPYGKHQIPNQVDANVVANLSSKSIIKNDFQNHCEITDKGKEIIKHIILHGEKSSFEDDKFKSAKINYEAIYNKVNLPNVKQSYKMASKEIKRQINWLQKIT